ncbi:golgin subfamily B member 1 isoform X2 [Erpetoichthys calabaricus]|uniref:golgin subfamily B member 1 isoform X2 n=1 Tax=Erpetoichthys calabaricus TaxID=27687 RepID=UPI0022341D44|nr:golgin subfamily B member 1 isoform X2 [Erpetoichthys calabaricus]
MLSRLSGIAKGVNSVLHELSGDGSEDPQQAEEGNTAHEHFAEEDVVQRLSDTEQLVEELKKLIKEKDAKLQLTESKLKEEREAAEAKMAKLKLQAKAKVLSLNKHIEELKMQHSGTEIVVSPNTSLTLDPGIEEEIEKLRAQAQHAEADAQNLREMVQHLQSELMLSEEKLQKSETLHAEQLQSLQEVVREKDLLFQEQVCRHKEELTNLASQSTQQTELQQLSKTLQRKVEEMEEALHARSQVIEMLQHELDSCEQQRQVLNNQFTQMEKDLQISQELLEEERLRWTAELSSAKESTNSAFHEKLEAEQALSGLRVALCSLVNTMHAQEEEREELSYLDVATPLPVLQEKVNIVEKKLKEKNIQCKQLKSDLQKIELESQHVSVELQRVRETSAVQICDLEQQIDKLQKVELELLRNKVAELEEEKGSLQLHVVDFEELRTENESLRLELSRLQTMNSSPELIVGEAVEGITSEQVIICEDMPIATVVMTHSPSPAEFSSYALEMEEGNANLLLESGSALITDETHVAESSLLHSVVNIDPVTIISQTDGCEGKDTALLEDSKEYFSSIEQTSSHQEKELEVTTTEEPSSVEKFQNITEPFPEYSETSQLQEILEDQQKSSDHCLDHIVTTAWEASLQEVNVVVGLDHTTELMQDEPTSVVQPHVVIENLQLPLQESKDMQVPVDSHHEHRDEENHGFKTVLCENMEKLENQLGDQVQEELLGPTKIETEPMVTDQPEHDEQNSFDIENVQEPEASAINPVLPLLSQVDMLQHQMIEKEQLIYDLAQKLEAAEVKSGMLTQETSEHYQELMEKTEEICVLRRQLQEKEQEAATALLTMSSRVDKINEEKTSLSSEMDKLKEQLFNLEDLEQKFGTAREGWMKDREDLLVQVNATKKESEQVKKKLQTALVSRKELLKKVKVMEDTLETHQEGERTENDKAVCDLEILVGDLKHSLQQKEERIALLENQVSQQLSASPNSCFPPSTGEVIQQERQDLLQESKLQEPGDSSGQGKQPEVSNVQVGQLTDVSINKEYAEAGLLEVVPQTLQKDLEGWNTEWVDFSTPTAIESYSEVEQDLLTKLGEQLRIEQAAKEKLESQLQESQSNLVQKQAELNSLLLNMQVLQDKEKQIDSLVVEMEAMKGNYQEAEAHTKTLKAEMEADQAKSSISELQMEVEEFKRFLGQKNEEISDLSCQLNDQNIILKTLQETVSEKDKLICTLQEERSKNLQQEEEGGSKQKEIQRKLQAALISRKEALKESKMLKEELTIASRAQATLTESINVLEKRLEELKETTAEMKKLKEEKIKLIEEVDQTLVQNHSLTATCDSLKLAMEAVVQEKQSLQRELDLARTAAEGEIAAWQEKLKGLQDDYEELLKSYENVSDEAERTRRVLEAARQERQDLLAKVRAKETEKQEVLDHLQESRKEVEEIKEKMRKFAKSKQQKLLELEEENERLRLEVHSVDDQKQHELEALKKKNETLELEISQLQQQIELTPQEETICLTYRMPDGQVPLAVSKQHKVMELEGEKESLVEHSAEEKEHQEELEALRRKTEALELEVSELQRRLEMSTSKEALSVSPSRLPDGQEPLMVHDGHVSTPAALDVDVQTEERVSEKESLLQRLLMEREGELQEAELHRSAMEAEKDDLEEKLMNQLAELNCAIANSQQEALEKQETIVALQGVVKELRQKETDLQRELLGTKDEAKKEHDRAEQLNEEKRHLQRDKAHLEAGRLREFEQKLKAAQQGKEGSQNYARQLQDLLREKQAEVRQLQKDCIMYQERISSVEKCVKTLELERDEAHQELQVASQQGKNLEAELSRYKVRIDDIQSEAGKALAERERLSSELRTLEQKAKERIQETENTAKQRLEAELNKHQMEARLAVERLEALQRDKERAEVSAADARAMVKTNESQIILMQARLDESLAKLAAFGRSMSSLQDDRDRVLDEARQWENRFHNSLQGKEKELREREQECRTLAEKLTQEVHLREELQEQVLRLENSCSDLNSRIQAAENKHQQAQDALLDEAKHLRKLLEESETSLVEAQKDLAALRDSEATVRECCFALEKSLDKEKEAQEALEKALRVLEAENHQQCLSIEQLQADLRASKELTELLQGQLAMKEQKEVELLEAKELALAQAVEEARTPLESRVRTLESEVAQRQLEAQELQEKARRAVEESSQNRSQLVAFTSSMTSLQNDRDRILSDYKQLEARHLQAILEKDALIQEAAAENNRLKQEQRGLLAKVDDLNADNAKLGAQLLRYRQDLTQVLGMKDSQHKQLLKAQLERIEALEVEKAKLEKQEEAAQQAIQALEQDKQELMDKLKQNPTESELHALQEKLLILEAELEDKVKVAVEKDTGILRNEAEIAEERVAELARDLMEMEQKLLTVTEEAQELRVENASFGKAMDSLQSSREETLKELEALRSKDTKLILAQVHEERDQLAEELARIKLVHEGTQKSSASHSQQEVQSLRNALSALQCERERLLVELKKLQDQHLRFGQEAGEMNRLQEEIKRLREDEKDSRALLQQLDILRAEKETLRMQSQHAQQQYLDALSGKEQQLTELKKLLQEARSSGSQEVVPGSDSVPAESQHLQIQLDDYLKQLHQKELRVEQLNSKLSQMYEEKASLVAQVRGSSQGLRDAQLRLSEMQGRCTALQSQLQELQDEKGSSEVDTAPGAPQEKGTMETDRTFNDLKELQQRLRAAEDQEGLFRLDLQQLEEKLAEEQDRRLALEEVLAAADEQRTHLQATGWTSTSDTNLHERTLLIESGDVSVSRTRSSAPRMKRLLRSLLCSRHRTPLLASVYLVTVHVLLLLCFTGHL